VIKAEFSASVFRVTWSFRNHSNMAIWCPRNISYSYNHYKYWKQFYCI